MAKRICVLACARVCVHYFSPFLVPKRKQAIIKIFTATATTTNEQRSICRIKIQTMSHPATHVKAHSKKQKAKSRKGKAKGKKQSKSKAAGRVTRES